MKNTRATVLSVLLIGAYGISQPTQAQPAGLRVTATPNGLSLSGPDGGLRLNLSLPGDTQQFGPLFSTSGASAPGGNSGAAPVLSLGDRSTISADWLDLGKGFRTSIGLSWRQSQAMGAERTLRDADSSSPGATPYLSLGWRGEPFRNSGWKMSAEVGAYVAGYGECRADRYCVNRSSGLNPQANPSGFRWSPFITFGATLSY